MRTLTEEEIPALRTFLESETIASKHSIAMGDLEWMISTTLKSEHMGWVLVSESDGAISGFVMGTYEFSDWRSGLCHWI
jgi:hypothetical protein